MHIEIRKSATGAARLTVTRADGTWTAGRLGQGGFGAVHDLAHFVVETTLGRRDGFYGLLEQGWNISDFERPGAARDISDEAIAIECIVGQLTNLVLTGPEVDLTEFNWLVAEAIRGARPSAIIPTIDSSRFTEMQRSLSEKVAAWRAIKPGDALQFEFALASS
ncbi:MAG TPA: hypothetical protein VHD32_18375 [Candidatus Didemnitutus sp.]|nr:hypothetical protein [Candidatus Didemnitutus sp.]